MNKVGPAIFGALAVVLLVVAGVWFNAERAEAALVLWSAEGQVERVTRSGVEDARVGSVLAPGDWIRTGPGAQAELALGSDTRMQLRANSAVEIRNVDEQGVHIELENGSLRAVVRPSSGALRISSRDREVLGTDAEFELGSSDDGAFTARAIRGTLSVSGVPDRFQIEEGSRLVIAEDGQTEFGPIPDTLLLTVDWPGDTRRERAEVTGSTDPGAMVRLETSGGTTEVRADHHGRFATEVPLVEGDNEVHVNVTDLVGNTAGATSTVKRDSRAPAFRIGVEYEPP